MGTQNAVRIAAEDGSQSIILECNDPEICNNWFNTLQKALTLHVEEEERSTLRLKCCRLLEIDPSQTLTKQLISRTYKRLALQSHPDKGGDMTTFNKINQAYTNLLAIQADEVSRLSAEFISKRRSADSIFLEPKLTRIYVHLQCVYK